jgi:hypothetical protein
VEIQVGTQLFTMHDHQNGRIILARYMHTREEQQRTTPNGEDLGMRKASRASGLTTTKPAKRRHFDDRQRTKKNLRSYNDCIARDDAGGHRWQKYVLTDLLTRSRLSQSLPATDRAERIYIYIDIDIGIDIDTIWLVLGVSRQGVLLATNTINQANNQTFPPRSSAPGK